MATHIADRCDFKTGDCIDSKYVVLESLGEGSFGKVYKVNCNNAEYALKMLRLWEVPPEIRESLMDRFEMEFHTGRIDCEYLVQSIDYGTVKGNPYIVMEYCPGGDLVKLIGRNSHRINTICRDILLGLKALHSKGKVHRDLKPENVLFKENGSAALTDFGIAGDRNKRMTERNIFGKPHQIFGTYAYMPPEQVNRVRGEATVLPTTDIFSFGVLTYQLLTGELPFGSLTNHNELAEYQKRGKNGEWNRRLLSDINNGKEWINLIEGCLKPSFKERFQTIDEVLAHLPGLDIKHHGKNEDSLVHISSNNYRLRIMHGDQYGMIYELSIFIKYGKRVITMGRDINNILTIMEKNSTYISRHHCSIEANEAGDKWILRDGQWNRDERKWICSSNGTFINSTQVSSDGLLLKTGDIISIGDVKILFEKY